jgi:hypothetical protein
MEILRTNYSTLSPYAQQDAPSAPEYPYKEFLAACRGKIEAAALDDSTEQDPHYLSNSSGSSQEATTKNEYALHHSKAFQKILTHFFGDYFTVDADEELASDMADRWASFSRTSDPNYEGSPKEWLPWWNRQTSSFELRNGNTILDFTYTDVESLWNDFEEQNPFNEDRSTMNFYDEDEFSEDFDEYNSYLHREQYYRQKALSALNLEVAEEDVFRTELRRSSHKAMLNGGRENLGGMLLSQYYKNFISGRKNVAALDSIPQQPTPRFDPQKVLSMAQEMGIMGKGLLGNGKQRSEFLPEFLDLSWPPEERLVERDCTCDMWDKLGYRY